MTPKRILFITIALLLVFGFSAWGAETGKITGTVLDVNGNPLYGANVSVLETNKGAMTNEDGIYTIFVAPGTYDIKATYIGYSPVTKQGVRVKLGLTSTVDFELEEGAMDLGIKIDVSGERAMVEKDVTSSEYHHSGEDIAKQAAANFTDVLEKEAGFVRDANGGLHVQGGRTGQILYTVDGMPVRDVVEGNDMGIQISNNAISELMVASGGFDAEYGDAQSAVVNIVTRTGSSDRYSGSVEYRTDDFGDPSADYTRNTDVISFNLGGPEPLTMSILPALGLDLPKLFSKDGNITFFLSGEGQFLDGYLPMEHHEYPSHKVFGIKFSDRKYNLYTANLKVAYDMTPRHKLSFGYRYSRTKRMPYLHDYTYHEELASRGDGQDGNGGGTEGGVGGNMNTFPDNDWDPITDDLNGNGVPDGDWDGPNLDANGDGDPTYDPEPHIDEEFPNGMDDDGDWIPFTDWNGNGVLDYVDYNENGRFDYGIDKPLEPLNSDLNGNGKQDIDYDGSAGPHDSRGKFDANGDGNMFWDPEPGIDEDLNSYYPYDPFTGKQYNPTDHNLNMFNLSKQLVLEWSHNISSSTFYTLKLSSFHLEERDDVLGKEPWEYVEYFPSFATVGFKAMGDYLTWQRRSLSTYTAKLDMTSQVVPKYHQLKFGLEGIYYELENNEISYPWYFRKTNPDDGGPYQWCGNYRYFWKVYPWTAAAYIQDKMEFEGLIVKLGLRYDFWDVGEQAANQTTKKDVDGDGKLDVVYSMDKDLDGEVTFSERIHDQISPRLAISHPITDRDVLYFNYGHFSQRPQFDFVYTESNNVGDVPLRGNPNLQPEKTVTYQLGVSHQFTDNISMTVSGFYKDITDLIAVRQVVIVPFTYNEYQNKDYGSSKGFELSLVKRYSNYTSGRFNYTISWAKGNSSSIYQGYNVQEGSSALPLSENPLDWDERHIMNANLDFRVRKDENPELFGFTLPDRWGVNLSWQYGSGKPFSPAAALSGETITEENTNSMRMPWTMVTDLRLNKDFTYSGIDYSVYLWVENLFDRKNINTVYSSSGEPDWNAPPGEEEPKTFYTLGHKYWENPGYYDPGRHILIGVRVEW